MSKILKVKQFRKSFIHLSAQVQAVVEHLVEEGDYVDLVRSGVRIMENACGACIGMGCAPASNSVSVRTFNRNFEGRSGTRMQRYI